MTAGDIGVLLFLGVHLWLLWRIASHLGRIVDSLTDDDLFEPIHVGHAPPHPMPAPASAPQPEEPCSKS